MPSAAIASTRYDESSNTLVVVFRSGRVYRYYAVPAAVHRELEAAPSKGRFFNEVIRPRYPCDRVR
ncbi:MAG TPA: KTSC domain-containing protein [Acidimicrobiales bacterium]|nr:KTSC domain-containing protein [Acidimicrobiales bacterium]